MLHLITGGNGSGKTLNTLMEVKTRADKEGRPVCHNGRFDVVPDGPLASWKKIDFDKWQDEPDGTIFFIDEAHNDLPKRPASGIVPDAIKMLAEHRKRGFDFYLITQHPLNIDSFVRRLIRNPGWHRDYKRIFGAEVTSQREWESVEEKPERPGAANSAQTKLVPFPKEVYTWYTSAVIHTGKKKIPRMVWILGFCMLLAPVGLYLSISGVYGNVTSKSPPGSKPGQSVDGGAFSPGRAPGQSVLTTLEYLEQRKARIPEFPHTAPVYDAVTKPSIAPFPAACVAMGSRCECYTQQATLMTVSDGVCRQIVVKGYFVDWNLDVPGRSGQADRPQQVAFNGPVPSEAPRQVVLPVEMPPAAAPMPHQQLDGYSEALARRNAQVRSILRPSN